MKNKPEDQNSELSFLEKIARSRSKEHVESKKQLENAPYHPSEELLRQYVLAELDKSDTEIVMEHLSLCGLCSRKALKITWELNETESLISRIKDFVSSLSFPVSCTISCSGSCEGGRVGRRTSLLRPRYRDHSYVGSPRRWLCGYLSWMRGNRRG